MERFRRFLTTTTLFFAAPLPLFVCLTLRLGGWRSALETPAGELLLVLLYWLPIGAWLSFSKSRFWTKLLLGYLLSLPLYFMTLTVLYPLWGGTPFHPFTHARLFIYISATPTFYGIVRLVFFLSTFRAQRWTRGAATLACAAGICAPVFLVASTGLNWPSQTSRLVITGARIVDASSNTIIDGQSVYTSDGRITEIAVTSPRPDWPRLDAHGRYLLPGLIDVHTHLQSPVEMPVGFRLGYFMKSMMGDYSVQRSQYLESGVTAIRDLGGSAEQNFRLRAAIDAKKTLGPRFFRSGRLVTSPHGHPVSTIWPDEVSRQGQSSQRTRPASSPRSTATSLLARRTPSKSSMAPSAGPKRN